MNGEEKNFLNKELAVLRAQFTERWNAHDLIASERNTSVNVNLTKIFSWLEKLPCNVHNNAIGNLTKSIDALRSNEIHHLNMRLNILLFTVLGGVSISIIVLGVKALYAMAGGPN